MSEFNAMYMKCTYCFLLFSSMFTFMTLSVRIVSKHFRQHVSFIISMIIKLGFQSLAFLHMVNFSRRRHYYFLLPHKKF